MLLSFGRKRLQPSPLEDVGQWMTHVQEMAGTARETEVVVDMAAVACVNSRELSEILKLELALRDRNKRLILHNVQKPVCEVFELTRLTRLVEVWGYQQAVRQATVVLPG